MMPNGQRVDIVTLTNTSGMAVDIVTYGATVTSVKVPRAGGGPEEVTVCPQSLDALRAATSYFGATVGRVANRIAKATFVVGGKTYTVAANNGANSLHGGVKGLSKVVWESALRAWPDGTVGARFTYASHDGEEGFPGAAVVTADYRLTPANEIEMVFSATPDAATPFNLCNHVYWNLSGGAREKITEHELQLHAPYFVEIGGDAVRWRGRQHGAGWGGARWKNVPPCACPCA